MIQRAVSNLIDNALKYTSSGGRVSVTVKHKERADVFIEVSDTGRGIDPGDRERIFERFFRCDPARGQGGTGLGLSLARAVVREHGGDVMVKSTPGQGSLFVVTLPLF